MVDEQTISTLMGFATSDDKASLEAMLSKMSANDKAYFYGYVAGYAEAVIHMGLAKVDEFSAHDVESADR